MSNAKRINGTIRMDNGHCSFCHNCLISNSLDDETNGPIPYWKLDGRWITLILLPRYSKSKIYETSIMRRWCISWHAGREVKIDFTSILWDITGIGRQIWSILFQEISRLLKYPREGTRVTRDRNTQKKEKNGTEKYFFLMQHRKGLSNDFPLFWGWFIVKMETHIVFEPQSDDFWVAILAKSPRRFVDSHPRIVHYSTFFSCTNNQILIFCDDDISAIPSQFLENWFFYNLEFSSCDGEISPLHDKSYKINTVVYGDVHTSDSFRMDKNITRHKNILWCSKSLYILEKLILFSNNDICIEEKQYVSWRMFCALVTSLTNCLPPRSVMCNNLMSVFLSYFNCIITTSSVTHNNLDIVLFTKIRWKLRESLSNNLGFVQSRYDKRNRIHISPMVSIFQKRKPPSNILKRFFVSKNCIWRKYRVSWMYEKVTPFRTSFDAHSGKHRSPDYSGTPRTPEFYHKSRFIPRTLKHLY